MTDRPTACSDRQTALHALVDGELDALSVQTLEGHVRGCPGCHSELARIETLRTLMADASLRHNVPPTLRHRIAAATGASTSGQRHTSPGRAALPWLGGGLAGALAASIALFLAVPDVAEPGLADAIIDGQIRSLQSGHLVDVLTSDQHTVKPWFNGRITYAPPVVDLKAQGFPLVGGRLDVVERENVAVLVYKRRLHTINLMIRFEPALASPLAAESHKAGYNLIRWTNGGLEFWAVSDLDTGELELFHQSFFAAIAKP